MENQGVVAHLLALAIVVYGLLFMVNGPKLANRFYRGLFNHLWNFASWLLRGSGKLGRQMLRRVGRYISRAIDRASQRYPVATGLVVLGLVLATLFLTYSFLKDLRLQ